MEMLIHGTDSLFCSWYVYYKNQYMDTLEELFDVHKSVWAKAPSSATSSEENWG